MPRREIPSPKPRRTPVGCWLSTLLLPLIGWSLAAKWPSFVTLGVFSTAPLGVLLVYSAREALLLRQVRRWMRRTGKRGVLIYSNSPNWQEHVEREWLPALQDHIAVLNWSERKNWIADDVAVRLFDSFVGRTYQYNPAVLVLQDDACPLVFRFYQAFKDAKHGRAEGLRNLESRMLEALNAAER